MESALSSPVQSMILCSEAPPAQSLAALSAPPVLSSSAPTSISGSLFARDAGIVTVSSVGICSGGLERSTAGIVVGKSSGRSNEGGTVSLLSGSGESSDTMTDSSESFQE